MSKQKLLKDYILSHMEESKTSALQTTKIIQDSELNAGNNNYTRTLHIPKIFSKEDQILFNNIVNQTYTIFTKVIQAYKSDVDIRALFPFPKELEELIFTENPYSSIIPICRIDIFFNEDTKDFYFCEFNTDGTSAMNENARINEFLSYNNVMNHVSFDYEIMEVLYKWAYTFLDLIQHNKDLHVGIADFLEHSYLSELYVYERIFKELGYICEVVHMKDLLYQNGHLYSKKTNQRIDVIYRRAVTKDVLEHYNEILPFIQAVKDQNVIVIGSFQTHIVHHKEISKALFHPLMQKYFTHEENDFIEAHCPKTYDLCENIVPDLLSNKDHWIIKPKDGYASIGVYTGIDQSEEEWKSIVEQCIHLDYIAQVYIPPYKSENIDLVNHDSFAYYSNLTGLYCFDGKFAGVYSRCSDSGIISSQYNEKMIPTLFVEENL